MIGDEYNVPPEVLKTAQEEQERRAQSTVSHASHLQLELPHCADGHYILASVAQGASESEEETVKPLSLSAFVPC